jgi:putative endonuclease
MRRQANSSRAMDSPWVYLLRCDDGSLYAGWTSDLGGRMRAHATGRGGRYTSARLPVRLARAWPLGDRRTARRAEAAIKRLPRERKLDLIDCPELLPGLIAQLDGDPAAGVDADPAAPRE